MILLLHQWMLMHYWLIFSQALYLSDVYNEAYLDAKIHQITTTTVNATIYGIPITGFDVVEIKAGNLSRSAYTAD